MKGKKIPSFKSEDDERDFWEKHSPLDYFDWASSRRLALPNLKPSVTTISIRMPSYLLAELKMLANSRDVAYQSLIKVYLAERVQREMSAFVAREGKVDYSLMRKPRKTRGLRRKPA